MKKLIFLIFFPLHFWAQSVKDTTINIPYFAGNYSFQFPKADLQKMFGPNSSIGTILGYKHSSNFIFELETNYIFSSEVKDTTMLDFLKTTDGNIIDKNGEYSNFRQYERGYSITGNVGKLFPIIGPNPNSGLMIKIGVGSFRYKVRTDVQHQMVPELQKKYLKYYDRLTLGVTLKQYIGYQHFSNNRLANFSIGFEIYEAFTRGMRDYQIDLGTSYKMHKFDVLFGPKVSWVIPVNRKTPDEFYYN